MLEIFVLKNYKHIQYRWDLSGCVFFRNMTTVSSLISHKAPFTRIKVTDLVDLIEIAIKSSPTVEVVGVLLDAPSPSPILGITSKSEEQAREYPVIHSVINNDVQRGSSSPSLVSKKNVF